LPNEKEIKIGITTPESCWGKAGLHTGDILKTVNGKSIASTADFRNQIRTAKIGDSVSMEMVRSSKPVKIDVLVSGYLQPVVHLTQLPAQTEKQKRLFSQWSLSN
jgi:S1-C subfamily serine protease